MTVFLSLTTTGCALTAAAVTDTTKRTASKIASILFIPLDDCFNIYFTPVYYFEFTQLRQKIDSFGTHTIYKIIAVM